MTCTRWPKIVPGIAAMLTVLAQPALVAPANAQTDPASVKLSVRVSPVIVAEPEVETQLSIVVGPEGAVPKQTFVRIKGLPQTARLSDGHIVSAGIWAVPLAALPTLRLTAPLSSSGRSDLTLTLVTVDGTVLNEVRSSLVVAPAWLLGSSGTKPGRPSAGTSTPAQLEETAAPAPAPQTQAAAPSPALQKMAPPAVTPPVAAPLVVASLPPPPPPTAAMRTPPPQIVTPPPAAAVPQTPAPPQLSAADRTKAEDMIRRGDAFMNQGNVAVARQFFRRAADMGLGLGALRLGTTFDPYELAAASVVGLQPDAKQAMSWYEKARELGTADAAQRLGRLQGSR